MATATATATADEENLIILDDIVTDTEPVLKAEEPKESGEIIDF